MLSLKGRQDGFRIILPKEFLAEEIVEKYTNVLQSKNGFFVTPIDFLNETIQSVDVLGFENGVFLNQQQSSKGRPLIDPNRVEQNKFMYPSTEYAYRSDASPIALMDKTLNIVFRHTLGYLNYFMLFENFWYQYARDRFYRDLVPQLYIDIFNETGCIYSRIVIDSPLINGMDMLSFNYTQPTAQSQTFKVELKYSNFDFQFLEYNTDEVYSLIRDDGTERY